MKKYIKLFEEFTNEQESDILQKELINPSNISKAKTELANNKIPYTTVVVNASTFFRFKDIPDFKKGISAISAVIDPKLEKAQVEPK